MILGVSCYLPEADLPNYPVKEPFSIRAAITWGPTTVCAGNLGVSGRSPLVFKPNSNTWKTAALKPHGPQFPHLGSRNDDPSFRWSSGELNKMLVEG